MPRIHLLAVLAVAGTIAAPAHSAHPLISEDTGTQGAGKFELELGASNTRQGSGRTFEVDPQLSSGIAPSVDAIVRASAFDLHGDAIPENGARRGFGTTMVDVKWRFAQADAWSFGTRAGIDLPSARSGFGYQRTGAHALIMATADLKPLLFTTNLAWTRLPSDAGSPRDQYRISAAALWTVSSALRLAFDIAHYSVPDADSRAWASVALAGAIYTVHPGFDLDIGWQQRLRQPAPAGVLFLGATLRW